MPILRGVVKSLYDHYGVNPNTHISDKVTGVQDKETAKPGVEGVDSELHVAAEDEEEEPLGAADVNVGSGPVQHAEADEEDPHVAVEDVNIGLGPVQHAEADVGSPQKNSDYNERHDTGTDKFLPMSPPTEWFGIPRTPDQCTDDEEPQLKHRRTPPSSSTPLAL